MFSEYPYINKDDINLDYVLKKIKTIIETTETFVNTNTIKYADPIEWDITSQYEANTVVIDPQTGNAYISTRAVPGGVAINNVDYWTPIFNYQSQIDDLSAEVQAIRDDLTEEIESAVYYVTPEMYGAVGDGTTDDTVAFTACAATGKPVIFPDKSYYLSDKVGFGNVILDQGTYTNYAPMYKKYVEIDSARVNYNRDIRLPVEQSYIEAVTYLDGFYYVAALNYDSDHSGQDYIAKYDSDFNYINHVFYPSTTYGNSNSIWRDDTFIYITTNNYYNIQFNQSLTITNVIQSTIRNYGYYNKTYWGITIAPGTSTLYEVESDLTTIIRSWSVSIPYSSYQSLSLVNGVWISSVAEAAYIPTVDLYSGEINKFYWSSQPELENFFEVDEKLCVSGHYLGMNGMFSISEFSGNDFPIFKYVDADCNTQFQLVNRNRPGVFRITNGTNIGLPQDEGDLIVMYNHIEYYCVDANRKYRYDRVSNVWRVVGLFYKEQVNVVADRLRFEWQTDGSFTLWANNFHLTQATTEYTYDIDSILGELKMRGASRNNQAIGWSANIDTVTNDIYAIQIYYTETKLTFRVRNITQNVVTNVNCYTGFLLRLF